MCGRFAQYSNRDEYFKALGLKPDEITFAPGTRVLLLNEQDDALRLDPVFWGYGPEWWDKQPLINARGERAHVQAAVKTGTRHRARRRLVRMEEGRR